MHRNTGVLTITGFKPILEMPYNILFKFVSVPLKEVGRLVGNVATVINAITCVSQSEKEVVQ